MTFSQAAELQVGAVLIFRDGTRWTVASAPTVKTGPLYLHAELRGPAGQRGYLTEDNASSFTPERRSNG